MKSYTLSNDFHHTAITLRCEGLIHRPGEVTIRPSVRQIARAKRALCPRTDCTCSGDAGTRGPQATASGKRLIVDLSAIYAAT